ncbi:MULTISPECIES: Hsp20/alpha crystallin family protein [Natrialbaceae]|uniref:Hsp20/alpha crystallin family protein n=1 Tax=Natrialbaceae TaxID=1644061 RepID=UPI00207C4337|nr:Hsp20/alpha crystallin family protein [Natronococcus sp. CG52]
MSQNNNRGNRAREPASDDCLIDTRFDDEFIVIADIPGVSKDDLSVGINPKTNTLVISKVGIVLERIPLPWQPTEATTVRFNNGVLEVRVRPTRP